MCDVSDRRFVNQFQPQTLVIATILCYIEGVLDLITFNPLLVLAGGLLAVGAYGIANEKRWGYLLATIIAAVRLVLFVVAFGADVLTFPLILTFLFDVGLVALLLHPQSREYQRIWFK
jgi:hypothetical protein